MKSISLDDFELTGMGGSAATRKKTVSVLSFFKSKGFGESVIDIEIEQTIEGASSVVVSVADPSGSIVNIKEFGLQSDLYPPEIRVSDWYFCLAGVSRSSDGILTLTFEDREVNALRRYTKPRKAKRAKVTRAEFCRSLVGEAKIITDRSGVNGGIDFVSPESNMKQVIGESGQTAASAKNSASGFPAGLRLKYIKRTYTESKKKGIKWKNETKIATRTQLNYFDAVFKECNKKKASHKVYRAAALMMLCPKNLSQAAGSNVFGLPRSGKWKVSADIDARTTFKVLLVKVVAELVKKSKKNPSWDEIKLVKSVTGRSESMLKHQRKSAIDAANAWLRGANRSTDVYEFTRGKPNGEQGENTWQAINRMAGEVGWRCWCSRGQVYFVSDEHLISAPSIMEIKSSSEGVNGIDWSQEGGEIPAECSVSVLTPPFTIQVGKCVSILDEGAGSGKWIIKSVSQSAFSPEATLTLTRAQPRLAEPKGDMDALAAKKSRSAGISQTSVPPRIKSMLDWCDSTNKKNYVYGFGAGDRSTGAATGGRYDCAGLVIGALVAGDFPVRGYGCTGPMNSWGQSGSGKYFTMYVKGPCDASGHVFLMFESASGRGGQVFEAHGPRGTRVGWQKSYPKNIGSYKKRHWRGF